MRTLTIVVALVLLPSLAFGQAQTTGRVNGSVVDEEGNPIAGARITIVSSALQGERIVKTAENGQFLASLLPPGAYAVTFNAPNKKPVQLSFRLGVGQTVPLDVTLQTGQALVENVQVHSTAPELESTELGESFDYDTAVEQLPIQDRTLESCLLYTSDAADE